MRMLIRNIPCFLLFTLLSSGSMAQTVTPSSVSINGNTLQAKLQVTTLIEVDLVVEFEKSVGLNADNINISATLSDVNASNITNRLSSADIKVIPTFPVIISISPKADAGFAFEGLASVEIYTKSVDYNTAMPARIFRSHANSNFEDITSMISAGSIRARGNTGSFSDFMLLLDERNNADVIDDTFSQLNQLVSQYNNHISATLAITIQTGISALQQALLMTDYTAALEVVEELIIVTENASGEQLSNVWRSSNDLVNMQGELLTRLRTLKYSLRVI
ncbi:DUF6689 family protein [uncultured Paraglaciecola sp.]|mgnify:CR=1 FL=1|jgi:hypothetical protein|uniref:DUF6689 family protein n=1 Tax=uncultured Paraglaciecola sp. TaxID=1765024 RepID=UPI00342785E0